MLTAVVTVVLLMATGVYEKFLKLVGVETDRFVEAKGQIIEYQPKGDNICVALKDTIIVVDENGVTGLDEDGKWKWNVFFEFNRPVVTTYSEIALITDVGGTGVFCFNESGLSWHILQDKGVIASYINEETGYLSVIHNEDNYKSCVTVYDIKNDNKPLFSRKFGAYYMMTADISADSSQMCLSGFYSEAGMSTAVLSFLRMRDGEVYTTEIFDDRIYPYIAYLKNNVLLAANSDELVRIVRETTASSSRDTKKVLWDRNANNTALVCLEEYKGQYLVAAFSELNTSLVSEALISTVRIYDSAGKIKKEFIVDGKVSGIEKGKNTIAVFTSNCAYMYNLEGILISKYEAVSDIRNVTYMGERVLLVSGVSKMAVVDMSGK